MSLNGLYKGPLVFKSGYQPLGKCLELLNYTHRLPIPLEVYPNRDKYLYSTNIAVLYEGTFPGVSKEKVVSKARILEKKTFCFRNAFIV